MKKEREVMTIRGLVPESESMNYRIGDRVEVTGDRTAKGETIGKTGTIKACSYKNHTYAVEFDSPLPTEGHDCNGTCRPRHGKWIKEYFVKKIK